MHIVKGSNFIAIEMKISWWNHDPTEHLILKLKTNQMWQAVDRKNVLLQNSQRKNQDICYSQDWAPCNNI